MKNLLFSFLILLNFISACSAQIIDAIIEGGTSSVARIYDAEVDLSALPSGIYTIQLTNKGGVFTGKVVRE